MFEILLESLIVLLKLYIAAILVRITLSWFPNINWYVQPFYFLAQSTDMYVNLFRTIVPPLFGFDLAPLFALAFLETMLIYLSNHLAQSYA
jgi:YggT family protein|uniref:Cell division protein Ycf19 n=1 Tax=Cyanidiaceae sp. MX-AZ01 TaxID=1503164 RepID=A0A060ADZ2_9RHOD|nr:Cell division protein Ycf19 [Cyanidiaceae sp. MX-AZ01]